MMKDRVVHSDKKKISLKFVKGIIASISLLCVGIVISITTISLTNEAKVTPLQKSVDYNYQIEVVRENNNNVNQVQNVKP